MTADAVGGVWTYALDLAGGLARRNIETVLAVLGPAPREHQKARAREIPGLALVLLDAPLDWTAESPGEVAAAARAVAALAGEVGADLLHLNSPALGGAALFPCPIVALCHSCVATWWAAVRGGAMPDDFLWRADLVRQGLARADAIVAPTAACAAATADAYGLARIPEIVWNGREPPAPSRAPAAPNVRGDVVLTAGRLWDEGKNVAALERIAPRLSLAVEAAGPTHGPNGAAIALSGVRALGSLSQDDMAARLARRPIFVSMARYEPFGLAVLEAAQAGCPLVLSDIPTFRELWEGAALFVPLDDEAALVAAIESVAGDPTRREALGEAAAQRSHRYTVEAMTERMIEVYARVLGRAAAGSVSRGIAA